MSLLAADKQDYPPPQLTNNSNNWWKIPFVLQMTDFIYFQCLSYIPSPSIKCRVLSCIAWLMAMPSHGQLQFDQVGGSIMGCSFFFSCFFLLILTGKSYWLRILGVEWL
jgi:hypothetical protein